MDRKHCARVYGLYNAISFYKIEGWSKEILLASPTPGPLCLEAPYSCFDYSLIFIRIPAGT